MINDTGKRRVRLVSVAVISFLFFVPALIAWLVNIHVAIQTLAPRWRGLLGADPTGIADFFVFLSGDLSTISTFVPLLLALFPLVQSLRILKRSGDDTAYVHAMEALPYPAHFPFFLVMLGLTGTLYGLWIGLGVSGVSAMTESMPNAADLSSSLERLLDGTATALLSSLLGLIGAFLAAKPLSYIFEWAAGIDPVAEEQSLAETIEHLTRDLKSLSAASRDLSANLTPEAVIGAMDSISAMEQAVRGQTELLRGVVQHVESMTAVQNEGVEHLKKLDGIADIVSKSGGRFDRVADILEQIAVTERQAGETMNSVLKEIQAERHESIEQLTALRASVERESDAARKGRGKLGKAFAAYLGGE